MKEQLCKIDLPEIEGFEDTFEFRAPIRGEYIRGSGSPSFHYSTKVPENMTKNPRWILRKSQEWVTPTDEDAKGRPEVEVKIQHSHPWRREEEYLLAVSDAETYFTIDKDGSVTEWEICRMKKELRK